MMNWSEKLSPEALNSLASNVARLSKLLTRERERLPAAYLKDHELRTAYLRYFLPANSEKIHIPLQELLLHPDNLLAKERLRVLDIGSGPGTALLGMLSFFAGRTQQCFLECTATDAVAENLREAEALFYQYRSGQRIDASLHTVKSVAESLERHLKGRFDIIILSNLLNELFAAEEEKIAKRITLVSGILHRFCEHAGSCIIIDPALRETSREMLLVRDGLLAEGFSVYSPCLIGTECPALAHPKDWCHEDVPWDPPEIIREIDQRTGLRKDSLKFSYLVLRKDGRSMRDVSGANAYRVVSEPLISKGKVEFYVCGPGGRRLVTRLDKDATSGNERFGMMKRGGIVTFSGLLDEEKRLRVGKETTVAVIPVR